MKTRLFPFVVARRAGAPSDILAWFRDPMLNASAMHLRTLQTRLQVLQSKLDTKIYTTINAANDRKDQNTLLNIKRDVFNGRPVQKYTLLPLLQNMDKLRELLSAYQRANTDIQSQLAELEGLFNDCIKSSVKQLRHESQKFYLKNGIGFSSQDTFTNLAAFHNKTHGELRKDEKHISLTLLRYLARSVAKTSPFSTFNNIFTLRICDGVGNSAGEVANRSVLSIHNIVYSLYKKAFFSLPELHQTFGIYVNPTLQQDHAKLHYFQNIDNQESFCSAEASPILHHIIDFVNKEKHTSYSELVNEIVIITGEPTATAIEYMEQLFTRSILLFRFHCNPKEGNWPLQLAELLREKHISNTKPGPHLLEMLEGLLHARDQIEQSGSADERQTAKLTALAEFRNKMHDFAYQYPRFKLGQRFDTLKVENLFFEDTVIDRSESPDTERLKSSFENIALLHTALRSCGYKAHIRRRLGSLLLKTCEGKRLPLLDFYKDIYLSLPETDPFETDYQIGLIREFRHFFQSIESQKAQDTIVLRLLAANGSRSGSFDLFAQVAEAKGRSVLIVNNMLSEGTTNISRFIDLCPDKQLAGKIRQQIEAQHPECLVAEILDASIHNVNNFPFLTGYVIDTSLSVHENSDNIRLNDLFVRAGADGAILLENSEGRRIIPIDFSMESIGRRSSLFRLLDLFSDANSEGISGLIGMYENTVILGHDFDRQPVVSIPRLCLSCGTVLSRKKWLVDADSLLKILYGDASEAVQFYATQNWRAETGIPARVFVRTGWGGQTSKPQYIDFDAPILFLLFKSVVKKASGRVEISEALPEPGDVTEYIFSVTYSH